MIDTKAQPSICKRHRRVLLRGLLCALALSILPTSAFASPLSWSSAQQISDDSRSIRAVSCPSSSFCAALDVAKIIGPGEVSKVFVSTSPTAGVAAWSAVYVHDNRLRGISCPSSNLCVAAGFDEVVYSTNPTGGAEAWHAVDLGGVLAGDLLGIDCPSVLLCVTINLSGDIHTSTNPTGTADAWTRIVGVDPDAGWGTAGGSEAVSCASETFCAAVTGSGNVLTSTNPTGGASSWSATEITEPDSTFEAGGLAAISCPSESFCTTVAPWPTFGVFNSSDPVNTSADWLETSLTAIGPAAISCPSDQLCVASGYSADGSVAVSSAPTGGTASWPTTPLATPAVGEPIFGLSCASEALCVAGDSAGNVFIGTPSGEDDKGGEEPSPPDNSGQLPPAGNPTPLAVTNPPTRPNRKTAKTRAAKKHAQQRKRALKRCKKLKGKAKRKCVKRVRTRF